MNDIFDAIKNLSQLEKKSLILRGLKLSEEVGELCEQILIHENAPGMQHKSGSLRDLQEECADVIIVALSIFTKTSDSSELFNEIVKKKLKKWQDKCGPQNI